MHVLQSIEIHTAPSCLADEQISVTWPSLRIRISHLIVSFSIRQQEGQKHTQMTSLEVEKMLDWVRRRDRESTSPRQKVVVLFFTLLVQVFLEAPFYCICPLTHFNDVVA